VHLHADVYHTPDRFGTSGTVCWTCSDPDAGRWVPVSFCSEAMKHIDNFDMYGGRYYLTCSESWYNA
jgi:hypothetical protein